MTGYKQMAHHLSWLLSVKIKIIFQRSEIYTIQYIYNFIAANFEINVRLTSLVFSDKKIGGRYLQDFLIIRSLLLSGLD